MMPSWATCFRAAAFQRISGQCLETARQYPTVINVILRESMSP
jgi:hypothetical protein